MDASRNRLAELWGARAKAFRKEIFPYLRYMAQSGFPSFLSLILIVSVIGYVQLIRDLPPGFPVTEVGIAALTPVLCWSPLRTWLAAADVVYLMPREHGMGPYLERSFRYSIRWSALPAVAVFLLYMPIYQGGSGEASPWLLAAAFLALKGGGHYGAWRERRMSWGMIRIAFRLGRWLLTAAVIGAWLTYPVLQAAAFMLLCFVFGAAAYRLPRNQRFPWEQLIREEETTRKRYYTAFGMFIDVPVVSSSIARRPYLSWIMPRIRYGQHNAYVYLFAASLLRTEIGGILIRLLLLGGLVSYWSADAASLAGWGVLIPYAIFASVFALQLGGLRHVNRYTVWKNIYPLPKNGQWEQYARLDRAALLAGLAILWLPASLPLLWDGYYASPIAMAAALLLYAFAIRPARMRRKLRLEADEEE
ncbi:ABC transporter permease [Paenibacillus sp. LHD-117]|uniref:ABC transporter permease n=1 Tax=Paenibacillus sp. LHD-117 TaxID=3071412 RepID=UPI0027DFACD0|nr:ABC transporter permease [Paenibacillus sp. LHD-117]MDQ6422361.1 ABC transporter permease [Paenibacillus sp. LHD-117]